jgi:hypothetical protein
MFVEEDALMGRLPFFPGRSVDSVGEQSYHQSSVPTTLKQP